MVSATKDLTPAEQRIDLFATVAKTAKIAYRFSAITPKKLDNEFTDLSKHTFIAELKTCDKDHNEAFVCCSN